MQLVAIDCGCHNVNGFCGVGKATLCQLDSGGRKIYGIARVHAGGNGAVHSLGKVVDRHAGFAAGRHDVSLVRIKIRAGFVQQGTDLGKGIFKVCRQLYTGNACARHSSGHRRKSLAHAADTVADSLHFIADDSQLLCCHIGFFKSIGKVINAQFGFFDFAAQFAVFLLVDFGAVLHFIVGSLFCLL